MFRYTVFRESKVSQRSTYPSEKHESHIVKILYKRSDSLFLGITMTKENHRGSPSNATCSSLNMPGVNLNILKRKEVDVGRVDVSSFYLDEG